MQPAAPAITQPNTSKQVNPARIRQKKIREFIEEHRLYQLKDFAQLQSFSRADPAIATFHHHTKTFLVKKDIETVWQAYKTLHPKDAWGNGMLSFGLQYSKRKNALSYVDDAYDGAEVGQIVLINLALLGGLVNIAVGHEITAVNEAEKYLETCYLTHGKSAGSQQIRLQSTPEGFTEITHHTIYKSDSPFRDKMLYPFLHTLAITTFHRNIKRHIMR
ncbi:MAG: hypothetical protein V4722_26010 [Bacteroidota bacterium]